MIINKLTSIENEIQLKIDEFKILNSIPKIIAVSKTFSINHILPLINHGQLHFGENKIQEALEKWSDIKIDHKELKLHMVGKLQTNKVKYAVQLFDYIHSLDNLKLAKKISNEQQKIKKNLGIFIQVNIGNEPQKSGIAPEQIEEFYEICINDLNLNIIGLMCLPPNNNKKEMFFKKMQELKKLINVKELSMGMSADYIEAIRYGATFIRIGSKIFGERS
jgi:PLP dependent protein|tara:strand:+ start:1802 stop:2461 length:660 start_codon:yes stop_codon:yes gene_type:complete